MCFLYNTFSCASSTTHFLVLPLQHIFMCFLYNTFSCASSTTHFHVLPLQHIFMCFLYNTFSCASSTTHFHVLPLQHIFMCFLYNTFSCASSTTHFLVLPLQHIFRNYNLILTSPYICNITNSSSGNLPTETLVDISFHLPRVTVYDIYPLTFTIISAVYISSIK